jgi:hypothetical protein
MIEGEREMSERDDIIEEIAALETEQENLFNQEQFLNELFWLCPDGPASKAADAELDEVLAALKAVSDDIEGLQDHLFELDEDEALRKPSWIGNTAHGRPGHES